MLSTCRGSSISIYYVFHSNLYSCHILHPLKSFLSGVGSFFNKFIYLFIFGCVGSSFCARAFSSCGKWGLLFIAVRGPLTVVASLVAEHRLQTCRLSNYGSRAQLLRGMWDLPRPELEPVSPALAGRFSTTAPPGKPWSKLFLADKKEKLNASSTMSIICKSPVSSTFYYPIIKSLHILTHVLNINCLCYFSALWLTVILLFKNKIPTCHSRRFINSFLAS